MKVDKMSIRDISLPKKSFKWTEENSDHNYLYIDLSSVDRITKTITEHIVVNASNAPSRAKQIVCTGDILFGTTRPLLKRSCIVDKKYNGQLCSTGFCVIRPNTNKVNTKWLHFALSSNRFYEYIKPLQRGIAYPAVSDKDVYNYNLSFPSLMEQQSIATQLDAIQSMIDGYKAQIADLDVLAQSIFLDMFGDPKTNDKGWNIFPLGEVCSMRAGKNIKASELSDTFANGLYPCYGGNGLRGYVNHFSHNCKTVIIGRQGALCGNVNIVEGKFYTTEHAVSLSPILPQTIEFIYYMLKEYNLNRFAKGAAQPGLSVGAISKKNIPLPPLTLQRQFSDRITLIETQKKSYQEQLHDAETLMSERMQYYFS